MKRTIILPAFVLILGVYVLIGCIPLPGDFKQPSGQPRPEKLIGKLNSDKPIRIDGATYGQVTETLGLPALASSDHSTAVYTYEINDVNNLANLCFIGEHGWALRHLLLRFAPDGRLQSFKTYKNLDQLRNDAKTPLESVEPYRPSPVRR
jgi:hypothetical protein